MGLLNRFFRSTEETAKQLVEDDSAMIKIWQEYRASTKEKGELIDALQSGQNLQNILQRLKSIVSSEFVKISEEEKTEEELLANLTAVEHEKNVKRVQKLQYCFCNAETKYKYVYFLLEELLNVLKQELHLVEHLSKGAQNEATFITKLKECWQLEKNILAQTGKIKIFHQLFTDLLKGEHVIKQLSKKEKRIISMMHKKMSMNTGLFAEVIRDLFKSFDDKVHEAVANSQVDGNRADGDRYLKENYLNFDFEFVNSPEFVDFVRTTVQSLREKKQEVSEETINVFIHLFREMYNAKDPS